MQIFEKFRGIACGCGLVAAMLGGSAMAEIQDLHGSVGYRERIGLPPEAVIEVTLEDVSKMDVASIVLARQTLRPEGRIPAEFRLAYDDRMVQENGRYSVRAVIRVGEEVQWRSTQNFAALTQGAPERVDVVVQRLVEASEVDLTLGNWLVVEMNGAVVQGDSIPQMDFGENGQVSGTSGCNQFTGSYTYEDGKLAFGPLASTRKACFGELNTQEVTFFETLTQVASAGVQSGGTVLMDSQGNILMRFLAE